MGQKVFAAIGLGMGLLGTAFFPDAPPPAAVAAAVEEGRVEEGQVVRAAWSGEEEAPADLLQVATVTLLPSLCAGTVVEDPHLVVTVAHCVQGGELSVRFHDGRTTGATVAFRDEERDHVLLALEDPAPVTPLPLAAELPNPGSRLLFGSRPERVTEPQVIEVTRLGPCPSLPGVPEAIFTSLDAAPGDSGSPLLDEAGAVAGMVHGGARCQIATPTEGLDDVARELY